MSRDRFGLTAKQNAFVQAYLYDLNTKGNASASYRLAYDCSNMSANAIHVEASKLINLPKISQRLEDKNKENEEKNRLKDVSLRQKIMDSLLLESQTANSDSARVQALNLLGRTIPNFFAPEKQELTNKVELSNSEKELEDAIATALNDGTVVSLLNSKNKLSPNMRDKKKA